jgi:hypothetical protein
VLGAPAARSTSTNPLNLNRGRAAGEEGIGFGCRQKASRGDSAPTCQLPPRPSAFLPPLRATTTATWHLGRGPGILTSGSHVPPRHLSAGSGEAPGDRGHYRSGRDLLHLTLSAPFVFSCIALQGCLFLAQLLVLRTRVTVPLLQCKGSSSASRWKNQRTFEWCNCERARHARGVVDSHSHWQQPAPDKWPAAAAVKTSGNPGRPEPQKVLPAAERVPPTRARARPPGTPQTTPPEGARGGARADRAHLYRQRPPHDSHHSSLTTTTTTPHALASDSDRATASSPLRSRQDSREEEPPEQS